MRDWIGASMHGIITIYIQKNQPAVVQTCICAIYWYPLTDETPVITDTFLPYLPK